MVSEWALMSHVACRNAYGGISPSSNPPLTKTSPADVRLGLGLRSGLEASAAARFSALAASRRLRALSPLLRTSSSAERSLRISAAAAASHEHARPLAPAHRVDPPHPWSWN